MSERYKTIEKSSAGEFKDRGSKFIALAYPVNSPEEVKTILAQVKKEHPKANHHCFAFRVGLDKNNFRVNDDGEPSGTAGKPILGQIDSFELTNVLIVVVRYFGGTLLGTPGLVNAYREAAREALQHANILERTIEYRHILHFNYAQMPEVMNWVKRENVRIISQEFFNDCEMIISVNKEQQEKLFASWRGLITG